MALLFCMGGWIKSKRGFALCKVVGAHQDSDMLKFFEEERRNFQLNGGIIWMERMIIMEFSIGGENERR